MYPRNNASPERLAVGPVVQISDGAVQTSGVSVKVRPQGEAASAGGGTTAYEEGVVHYTPTQAETNYTSFTVIAYKSGCIPAAITVVTSAHGTAGNVYVGTNNDKTGYGLADDAITSGKIADDAFSAEHFATDCITDDAIATGAIASTAFAAGAITNAAVADDVDVNVKTITAGAITAAAIATDAIDADALKTDALAEIADAVWDEAIAGHLSAGSTGELLQDIDDEVDYIHAVIDSIAVTGSALTKEAASRTLTTGTETSGTYASTAIDNGVYHVLTVASNEIDIYYEFNIGASGVPTKVNISGYLKEGAPAGGDTIDLYAYNWSGPAWELLQTAIFTGILTDGPDLNHTVGLLNRHVGTAGDDGKVRIRFQAASLEAGTTLNLDYLVVEYAESLSADVAAILVDTAEIGTAGAGLSAIPWNAAWDAEVQSECTDALNAYDPPTKAELDTAVANVSVDEIQASALADLFNTDSGTTYGAAVAGSPVKEITDNAGGGGLTAEAVADAVWDEASTGHTDAGKAGAQLWTDVDAVKVKTDQLVFTVPGYVDATAVATVDEAAIAAAVVAAINATGIALTSDDMEEIATITTDIIKTVHGTGRYDSPLMLIPTYGKVSSTVIKSNTTLYFVLGDTPRISVDVDADMTGYNLVLYVNDKDNVEKVARTMTWTDQTLGTAYADLTADELDTLGEHKCRVKAISPTTGITHTHLEFTLFVRS